MNNNQNLNSSPGNNGEVTPSSLSAVGAGDKNNSNLAAINSRRAATPQSTRRR